MVMVVQLVDMSKITKLHTLKESALRIANYTLVKKNLNQDIVNPIPGTQKNESIFGT